MELLGLKGTLKTIYFQPLFPGEGHLPVDKVSQATI